MIKQIIVNSVYTEQGKAIYEENMPQYATSGSAGLDLCACEDTTIEPGETKLVPLGISICLNDPNYVGILAPRSSLAFKKGLTLANGIGIIDSDYNNEIKALIHNFGSKAQTLTAGERVAQLLVMPVTQITLGTPAFRTFKLIPRTGGFGSTGTH